MNRVLNAVRNFIDVPSLDPDDRRRARLLNLSMLGMGIIGILAIALVTLVAIAGVSGWQNMLPTLWSALIFLSVLVFLFWLSQQRRITLASILFLLLLIFGILFAADMDTLRSGSTLFYFVIPIIMSSVLLRPYASFIIAGLIGLIFVVITELWNFPPEFLFGMAGMFAIAFVSWLSARSLENALQDLRIINEDLDRRVIERTEALARANRTLEDQARELVRFNMRLEQQAKELSEANERLKGLDLLKSKFVSDVTHELRTPINNLMIYMEMLKAGKRERLEQYLDILHEEASRLSQLVEDVLDLSRMELGRKKVALGWVELNTLVEQAALANQASVEAKGLALSLDAGTGLPKVWADPDQLKQVINNLVANAVNYTPQGSIRLSTWYSVAYQEVCLQVEDTGMGIGKEDLPHIFDRFYRGQQASQSQIRGTGLGLAIVKEIIEQHQGRIEVHSKLAEGTTFTVHLPVKPKETEA